MRQEKRHRRGVVLAAAVLPALDEALELEALRRRQLRRHAVGQRPRGLGPAPKNPLFGIDRLYVFFENESA